VNPVPLILSISGIYLGLTNYKKRQNSKLDPKKFSRLCTFNANKVSSCTVTANRNAAVTANKNAVTATNKGSGLVTWPLLFPELS